MRLAPSRAKAIPDDVPVVIATLLANDWSIYIPLLQDDIFIYPKLGGQCFKGG